MGWGSGGRGWSGGGDSRVSNGGWTGYGGRASHGDEGGSGGGGQPSWLYSAYYKARAQAGDLLKEKEDRERSERTRLEAESQRAAWDSLADGIVARVSAALPARAADALAAGQPASGSSSAAPASSSNGGTAPAESFGATRRLLRQLVRHDTATSEGTDEPSQDTGGKTGSTGLLGVLLRFARREGRTSGGGKDKKKTDKNNEKSKKDKQGRLHKEGLQEGDKEEREARQAREAREAQETQGRYQLRGIMLYSFGGFDFLVAAFAFQGAPRQGAHPCQGTQSQHLQGVLAARTAVQAIRLSHVAGSSQRAQQESARHQAAAFEHSWT